MDKFEEYIKARYPVDYEHLKEKYPNVPVGEFYGDEKDLWNYRQAEVEKKDKRIVELELALTQIKSWESHPKSYETAFGSWGLRDFYRNLADKALRGEQ